MNKHDTPIALEVRAFLARTGLSQARLAAEAGVNPVYVSRIVTGGTRDVWSRTADALRAAMKRLESSVAQARAKTDGFTLP